MKDENKRRMSPLMEVIKRKRLTTRQVADSVGISVRTLHNISCGNKASAATRQKITNLLSAQIWPGIEITESILRIPTGTIIRWPKASQTSEFLKEFGPVGTEIRKNLVKLLSDVRLRFTFNMSEPALTTAEIHEAAAAYDPDNVIEIWGPDDEAEALADADASSERAKPAKRHTPPSGSA